MYNVSPTPNVLNVGADMKGGRRIGIFRRYRGQSIRISWRVSCYLSL